MTAETAHEPKAADGRHPRSTTSRRPTLLLVVFAALVVSRSPGEGIHDIAFANLALDLSALVGTVVPAPAPATE
ncbi:MULTISPECIES: hypothetical protein [unclassified Streptomyces]|uniref:hypothetical protein n=1 Tax=unclassified Streptomyces TaxID=2593676 RepID=UPI0029A04014|nr:hypothetical protein [Streptomyces sp. DK15]MDX2393668.1 hypothetical protein [Streptomyces sp. DK15]